MNFLRNLMNGGFTGIEANDSTINTISTSIKNIITAVFAFLSLGAVILAIMLAYKFFTATDETKRRNAKMQLIYAIIAIVVLIILTIVIPQIAESLSNVAQGKKADGSEITSFMLNF